MFADKITEIIFSFSSPFNISDVIIRCSRNGITDKDKIYSELDSLRDSGLLTYREIDTDVWGYVSCL